MKLGQLLTQLLGHQHTKTMPRGGIRFSLPDVVLCAKCDKPVAISETTQVYMPDEDSDYHRVCQGCASKV